MPRSLSLLAVLLLALLAPLLRATAPPRWQTLFNGRDLDGWAGPLDAVEIKDGVITWRAERRGTIYWNRELGDFEVKFKFKVPPGGNNGLALRYPGQGDTAYVGLCELQILAEDYERVKKTKIDDRQKHGSAYGMVAAKQGFQKPVGEWNEQHVILQGFKLRVILNGTTILDTDLSQVDLTTVLANKPHPGVTRLRGFFGFAGHNDPVEFKDIELREL